MDDPRQYDNPLVSRYAGPEMIYLFSPEKKIRTWRRLWVALARAERDLGLTITEAQIADLQRHADDIDFGAAARYEKRFRHDVMAHIHTYGDVARSARGIIHLGATSAYVVDNTDLLLQREGLELLRRRLVNLLDALAAFARQYAKLPTVGFTHFQPAQLTTVGKRACLWIQDLLLDLEDLETTASRIRFLGVKGATGTQASFLELFQGDGAQVDRLDRRVTELMGFRDAYPVTGQTYSRKIDRRILSVLGGLAESAHKFSNDIRLLQHRQEVLEPAESEQIGSSAMAYKRNPMRCERIAGLARYLICLVPNASFTAAQQWFERTLDDSANKRLSMAEAFLAADGILRLHLNVARGLTVIRPIVDRHVNDELPFMATEGILMAAVHAGGDRQKLHERIRVHSRAVADAVAVGKPNDLIARIEKDSDFKPIRSRLKALTQPVRFVGRAPDQALKFLKDEVDPIVRANRKWLGMKDALDV